ncbi:Crp/Fnr family transcriptional regulator [Thaumasiovibrio subtropicus]|uniref:Crp/Fnr family transcriptional regulator n=1 Tax=Thaumasiovibrio subtropicus TaxID=1891207 RepID=UPI000B35BF5B|nr:Crp/Fnr family transcriptional regulator [Thaumasiovibrio subtropicus]
MMPNSNDLRLKTVMQSVAPISDDSWQQIRPYLTEKRVASGTQLGNPGEVCAQVMFLCEGVARSFVIDANGREYTVSFNFYEPQATLKNLFLTDFVSVLQQSPSQLYFEALTDLVVIAIPYEKVLSLYESQVEWGRFGRKVAEEAYCITQQRALSLLTLTAAERYAQMLKGMPKSLQQIPEHYVAAYLGITPQSLSRIKKQALVTK